MPKRRASSPADLRKLASLCRAGKLFAVQEWITAGRGYLAPRGRFSTCPFRAAVETGFHSLIELFLDAGVPQEKRDDALSRAVSNRRLDLVQLLSRHGADTGAITARELIFAFDPTVFRWFIKRGLDLETGYPIARALDERHEEFLPIYLDVRDSVPSARKQAAMALCVHVRKNEPERISRLLSVGTDARLRVPHIDSDVDDKDSLGSALEEAVRFTRTEIVRMFKVNSVDDDPTVLLGMYGASDDPELVQLLLDAGADPNGDRGKATPMHRLMDDFEHSLDPHFRHWHRPETVLHCLEIVGKHGGRWRPRDPHDFRNLRKALARAPSSTVVDWLRRILDAGIFEDGVFPELMRTPRMKEVVKPFSSGSIVVRRAAGYKD